MLVLSLRIHERYPQAYTDFYLSNRGAANFLVKEDGKMRKFELVETYYACSTNDSSYCFTHLIVSVRGKICWTMTFREDADLTADEASIYAECIRDVFSEIEVA